MSRVLIAIVDKDSVFIASDSILGSFVRDTTSIAMIRIIFVDDHPVFLDGLAALAGLQDDMNVVGTFKGVMDAKHFLGCDKCDVVVIDLTLDGDSGFDLIRWICDRGMHVSILVASMHEDAMYVERAMRLGAAGYVSKRRASDVILGAIRAVADGHSYVDLSLATVPEGGGDDPVESLSAREFEVFERIGMGLGTAEIAAAIHRSIKTIESHRAAIKKKLNIASAPELVRYATLWCERTRGLV